MEQFEQLAEVTPGEEAVETTTAKKKKGAKKSPHMDNFIAKIRSNPELKEILRSLSDSLMVVNSLSFSDEGSIVLDKTKPVEEDEKRKLIKTSKIVGYRIKNIGQNPIKYTVSQCTKDADGVWQEAQVEKVLNPEETAEIPKKYLTMLTSDPRFSFTLQNGYMKKSSKANPANTLDDELESWYFKASDDNIKVNADYFKINIGQEVVDGESTKWIVLPEYETVFGYLNNSTKKEKARLKNRKEKLNISTKDAAADYIQELLRNQKM